MHRSPYRVRDVMTRRVVAVRKGARYKEIVETLHEWKVSAVPVLAEGDVVIGVVSEADLLPKEEFRDSDEPLGLDQLRRPLDLAKAAGSTAEQVMSSPAVTVGVDATLAQAARIMAHTFVKRLPVVDAEGRLQGLVSRCDLLKVFLRSDAELAREIDREVVEHLFRGTGAEVHARVEGGVVTLGGHLHDASLVPVAARLARAVEGVVDVEWELDTEVTSASRVP
ncbi:CBS domain-containing protein [Streptomyces sp. R21]|uniref:CBS domain-containing protein n=1 Tax=Streptomyces sp. R21 TaxID=3238627 RepID=A0AB39PJZ9_9ACTN